MGSVGSAPVLGSAAVVVSGLRKTYGERNVLDGVSLTIEPGTVFGLLGPNGAGKTTLLESIVGLRRPTQGRISVLGLDPRRDRKKLTAKVSVQPQSANVFGSLTVLETLRLYASFHKNYRDVRQTIDAIGLEGQVETQARNLSGGQLRRLLLGVAIIGKPELVVLDEPSAGLDPEARRQLLGLIRSLKDDGTTVIFSTHDMAEATQICDRVVILADGLVQADGAPEQLIEEAEEAATLRFDVVTSESLTLVQRLLPDTASLTWDQGPGVYHLSYRTMDPDGALELLTGNSDVRGRKYRIERMTLEDYYLTIVRNFRGGSERVA